MEIPKQLQNSEFRFLLLQKGMKIPTADMKNWQNNNFEYNNFKFLQRLRLGYNYAIIGGYGNLVLGDGDTPEISDIFETKFPETFTVKTGSPEEYKKHYYFICDKPLKPIRLSKDKVGDLGDVRSVGQYVVAPNSVHPSGNKYEIIKDIPIAHIKEEQIREAFKEFIDPNDNTEFKEYPIITSKRSSDYIRECKVPDYVINNKLKGETSKNWKLFPYIVDILYNREVSQSVYETIVKRQGHSDSAIKGWVNKAKEGKLAKSSCEKMKNYFKRFHPELVDDICGKCKLNKIKNTVFNNEILTELALKHKDDATELLVEEIKKKYYIYTTRDDEKSEMWIYNEGIYIPHAKTFICEFCRKILGKAYSTQLGNVVISKIEADTYINADEFFSNNNVGEIAVENGILNLLTRELKPFNPKIIFFNKIPVIYNSKKECINIKKHFKTVLKNESDIKVMEELFGYCLLKEHKFEKAIMNIGSGRNGKSKTLELIKRFVGVDNCANIPLQQLEMDNFALGELFKKMVNLSGDINSKALRNTETFKSLTGRDLLSAPRKFLPRVNFVNYSKQIFSCNELPSTYDLTPAFFNRWIIFEYPFTFVSQKELDFIPKEDKIKYKLADPEIINKLTSEEELSGLLNISLDGLDRLLKQKDFSYSKSIVEVKDLWLRKSSSFNAFLMDEIVESYEDKIIKQDLKKAYLDYCKKYKLKMIGDKEIKNILTTTFSVSEERESIHENNNLKQIWVWDGIKFSKGSKDSRGFSIYRENTIFQIGEKMGATPTTLANCEIKEEVKKCTICGLESPDLDLNEEGVCEICRDDNNSSN